MLSSILLFATVSLSGLALTTPSMVEPRAASITCNHDNPVGGYFSMYNSSGISIFAGWKDTYKLADAIKAVGSSASTGSNPPVIFTSQLFNGASNNYGFKACTSTAMGYPANDTAANGGVPKFYGQLTVTVSTGTITFKDLCVTRRYVDYGHEFLTLEDCLTTDDSNLSTQYFRVTQTHAEYEADRWSIQNVGHPKGTSGKIYYWAPGTSSQAPAWTVHPDSPTAYSLEFRNIHIN